MCSHGVEFEVSLNINANEKRTCPSLAKNIGGFDIRIQCTVHGGRRVFGIICAVAAGGGVGEIVLHFPCICWFEWINKNREKSIQFQYKISHSSNAMLMALPNSNSSDTLFILYFHENNANKPTIGRIDVDTNQQLKGIIFEKSLIVDISVIISNKMRNERKTQRKPKSEKFVIEGQRYTQIPNVSICPWKSNRRRYDRLMAGLLYALAIWNNTHLQWIALPLKGTKEIERSLSSSMPSTRNFGHS